MQYREFGKTGIKVSAVGLGTARFRLDEVQTEEGLERAAQIVVSAANAGVNFIDSATTYSAGKCEDILKLALPHIKTKMHVGGKSSCYHQKTGDAVLRHIELSLTNIGIDCFDFYFMWNVKSFDQYQVIMKKGGPFEGVLRAKDQGFIKHICFSSHAPAEDAIKIIREGTFEGVTVSYSWLNANENAAVIQEAGRNGLGVAVMNPLGGGIIAQNQNLFSKCMMEDDRDAIDSALKFVYAEPAVSTVLCGISEKNELDADIQSLEKIDLYVSSRTSHALNELRAFKSFCTGCNYCVGCPADIPIAKLMTAYNQTEFCADSTFFNRSSVELIKHINFFRQLDGTISFDDAKNPCLKCGKCEKICTQSLPIIERVDEIYQWVDKTCASLAGRRDRLRQLLREDYRRVGFYTAGFYTSFVLETYRSLLGDFTFDVYVFDSDPKKWGQTYLDTISIRSPDEIPQLELDVVVISNYIHGEDIYKDLIKRFPSENIQRLHQINDIPWTF